MKKTVLTLAFWTNFCSSFLKFLWHVLISRLTLLLRSPIDGQMYSSEVDVGVGGAILVLVAASSVAKGVDGSDDTSSAFNGNSAPSSVSLNFAGVVSFSSLIIKIINYTKFNMTHNIR